MKSLWSNRTGRKLSGLDALVYTSRLIGANSNLVVWGGGNSSVKVVDKDHTGKVCRILWMKGSGSDMKTIAHKHFTPLLLDDLLPLMKRQSMSDEEMVDYQARCVMKPGAPKPSIETLLHAFLPPTHIYHTHADAICALTDTPHSDQHLRKVFGNTVATVPYCRPGFHLSKQTGEAYTRHPGIRGIILEKHGLVTWGETAEEAYNETIRIVTIAEGYIHRQGRKKKTSGPRARRGGLSSQQRRAVAASVAPIVRGEVSRGRRMVLFFDDDPEVLRFIDHRDAMKRSQIGPFTPDHLLHTKPWPLFVDAKDLDMNQMRKFIPRAMERYRRRYEKYFNRYKTPNVRMLDPNPRVILIPGLGMFTTGKDRRASRIVRDLYRHTMEVIKSSFLIESYRSLSSKDLCDFEYWPLENFKLTLLPPEKELSRRVALVTGAGGGIGQVISSRLAAEGAMVILTDLDQARISRISDRINEQAGEVQSVAIRMDVTSERSVREAFRMAVLAYGGIDLLVSNAGIARPSAVEEMALSDWEESINVNATGHFMVCREMIRIFKQQDIGGNIVVIATKNVLAPGSEFGAYSASKAAQVQLSRVLAIEGAKNKVRVNMINPDGIFESSGLWSKKVRKERASAYGIRLDQLEDFYAERNLLKSRIYAEDVAEAVLFFASDRSAKTTGAILPVDGGVREAFPR